MGLEGGKRDLKGRKEKEREDQHVKPERKERESSKLSPARDK